jgi:hypothetical protein
MPSIADIETGPSGAADQTTAPIRSKTAGSSVSGLLTRVLTGQPTILSKGCGRISEAGSRFVSSQSSWSGSKDQRHPVVQ